MIGVDQKNILKLEVEPLVPLVDHLQSLEELSTKCGPNCGVFHQSAGFSEKVSFCCKHLFMNMSALGRYLCERVS